MTTNTGWENSKLPVRRPAGWLWDYPGVGGWMQHPHGLWEILLTLHTQHSSFFFLSQIKQNTFPHSGMQSTHWGAGVLWDIWFRHVSSHGYMCVQAWPRCRMSILLQFVWWVGKAQSKRLCRCLQIWFWEQGLRTHSSNTSACEAGEGRRWSVSAVRWVWDQPLIHKAQSPKAVKNKDKNQTNH